LAERIGSWELDGADGGRDSRREAANDSAIIAFLLDLAFLSLNFLLRLKGRPLGRHPARTLPLSPENIF
jgi:hypothetical protein